MHIRSFFTSALTAVAAAALFLPLAGCGLTDTQAWKGTSRAYYTYVNTPAKLDLANPDTLSVADSRLVTRLMEIDSQLTSLERALDALPAQPDKTEMDALLRRFPWLSGLVLTDASGVMQGAVPSTPLKQLDFTPLLTAAPKMSVRTVRASVQDTPLGPELLIARPFFNGTELAGLLVATLDFRSMLTYVESPGDLIVRSPDVLLWSGDLNYDQTPLANIKWAETLTKTSYGTLSGKGGSAVWLTRYVGALPLVFATPSR